MRHRIIFLFCVLLFCFGLIYAQRSGNVSHQKKVTIGMIGRTADSLVSIASYSGAQLAGKELSIKYNIDIVIDWQTPAVENVEEQAKTLERFSRSKVDGIAIACSDANYLIPTIDQAVGNGIPVICFDSDAPKSKRFAYCGADDVEFGKMLIKEIAAELKGKGVIAILAGNKNTLRQQNRMQGLKDEIKKYPKIILSPENIYHNLEIPEQAAETITLAQQRNPNIQGWVFLGGWPLLVKNSIKWNPGEIKVVAGNAVPAELDYLKSGYVQSLVGINCFQIGYKTIEILLSKILKNKSPDNPLVYSTITVVKRNNVDEWSLNWKKWLLKETSNR